MVNFRINWTHCTGEVRNLEETPKQKPYRGRENVCLLFWFTIYAFFRLTECPSSADSTTGTPVSFISMDSTLQWRVVVFAGKRGSATGKNRYRSQRVLQGHYVHPNMPRVPDYCKIQRIGNRAKACEPTYPSYHKWLSIQDCLPRADTESTSLG